MTKCICLFLLCIIPELCQAQFDSLGLKSKWNKGFLVLNDDRTLPGLIKHNVKLGLVKFKSNPQETEQSFLERNIKMIEYFDSEISKTRKFARFNVNDLSASEQRIKDDVFEILMEFPDFAILCKAYPVNPSVKHYSNGYGGSTPVMDGYEQYEGIYLVNEDGIAECVLMEVAVEKSHQNRPAKVRGFYEKNLIEKYTGSKWPQVREYVKKNKLRLGKKEDMLKAFEYYSEIK